MDQVWSNQVRLLKISRCLQILLPISSCGVKSVNLRQNVVINLSLSGHMSENFPIPGNSTSETTVSPEVVQLYPKALFRIMKKFRKRVESASLTSTTPKQKN
ncbi:hypothetical protein AVEN_111041-1 [Araneus ventricosus]|uniref:Uncharacterized protein n=1 Tax=Araneus ventricosus TaxID=182803 RepID=A0A4Y2PZT3_ARAVE|nr:hypothetical protein AVEN_111041-1 [Araneus ventricosus]